MQLRPTSAALPSRVKEYHFHIYFLTASTSQRAHALSLRERLLVARSQGEFVAVPLYRINETAMGPHPVGSYEVWVPESSFAAVFSFLAQERGELSIFIHPLTANQRADHEHRNAWIGPPFPLFLDNLPTGGEIPSQYHSLELGYSSKEEEPSEAEKKERGKRLEEKLRHEKGAAKAPGWE